MKFSFKVGERINSETLEYPMTAFLKATRFFKLTFQKGRKTFSAVYQVTDSVGKQRVGTTFLLTKLFGDKKLPAVVMLSGGSALPCAVEIIDAYNLAEHAIKHNGATSENNMPVNLDVAFALSL